MIWIRQAREWQLQGSFVLHPTRDVSYSVGPWRDELAAQELLIWNEGIPQSLIDPLSHGISFNLFVSCPL